VSVDARLLYWTAALLNMAVVVACALSGLRRVRRGDYLGHRRRMQLGAWLVAAFLGSYALKVALLGREPLELWEPFYVQVLRFHELCVAAMVAGGATALAQARRLGLPRGAGSPALEPRRLERGLRLHRGAGWTAVVASALGLASAVVVLWGMYARA
jgi:uncharacterized membrane protein YozB (DUF420 family)